MALAPGQPHEPTVHPRTREEAFDYAKRNRGSGDWFRHDGKNVEEPVQPAPRLATKNAEDIAAKHKGEADQWFQHDPEKNPPDPKPATKCPTEESREVQEKVQGKEENWYKHDDNQEYVTPRAKHERLPDYGPSKSFKVKFTTPDTNDWYKHSSGGGSPAAKSPPPKPKKVISPRAAPDPPSWYQHDGTVNPDLLPQPIKNLTSADAEGYQQRNQGSASNWFGHDATAEPDACQSPRFASKEGSAIAKKLGRESENWFDHDANKDYSNPRPEAKGSHVSGMVERSRGQMGDILAMAKDESDASNVTKTRPEAKEIAEKNQKGLMDKYLAENKDYNSARPAPRVKPEATDSAEKNKGVLGDCLGGYPDTPQQHNARRVKPDAEQYALRNKGTMGNVLIGGDSAPPPERPSMARAVKPEAQKYAQRNKGSNLFEDMSISEPVHTPRLKSDAAREIASRNQGSLGGVLGFSG